MPVISGGTIAPGPAEIVVEERTFTENGAGTYTGSVVVPAGAWLLNIVVHAVALWTAATSASLTVGDGTDPDGWYVATDLKATDLTVGQSLSFGYAGGKAGAYFSGTATHLDGLYSASARTISGVVVSVGAGTAGRTRMLVVYSIGPAEPVAATKA